VKYLESLLIQNAGQVGRCKLINGTAHEYINLPESDRADMAFFTEQIRTVLPVLGLDFLRETYGNKAKAEPSDDTSADSPRLYMQIPKQGIQASAQEYEGEFIVMKGSTTRDEWGAKPGGYSALFAQLCEEGVLSEPEGKVRRFTREFAFSSPSAAGAIVAGYNVNGRTTWKVEGSGQVYSEWQDQQVSAVVNEASE
jgi:hypothetical protein